MAPDSVDVEMDGEPSYPSLRSRTELRLFKKHLVGLQQ